MMVRYLLLLLLLSAHHLNAHAEDAPGLKKAISLLSSTKTGAEELARAREMKIPLLEGRVSKTDITATRVLEGKQETLSFQTQVLVAQDKDTVFQALDLAHELVHATHPKSNPFDPSLNLANYVRNGIEGEGGEADAIATECQAGQELIESKAYPLKEETVQLIKARCHFVWKTVAQTSKWKKSFYDLGQYYHDFMSQVTGLHLAEREKAEWLEKVGAKSPMFASAVAHKPYPLALLEEYIDITKKVCERSRSKGVARALASLPLLEERCAAIGAKASP